MVRRGHLVDAARPEGGVCEDEEANPAGRVDVDARALVAPAGQRRRHRHRVVQQLVGHLQRHTRVAARADPSGSGVQLVHIVQMRGLFRHLRRMPSVTASARATRAPPPRKSLNAGRTRRRKSAEVELANRGETGFSHTAVSLERAHLTIVYATRAKAHSQQMSSRHRISHLTFSNPPRLVSESWRHVPVTRCVPRRTRSTRLPPSLRGSCEPPRGGPGGGSSRAPNARCETDRERDRISARIAG